MNNENKQNKQNQEGLVSLVPAQFPAGLLVINKNVNLVELATKFEKSKDVLDAVKDFVDKLNKIMVASGYKNKVGVVVVPALYPQNDKKMADAIYKYVNGIFELGKNGGSNGTKQPKANS